MHLAAVFACNFPNYLYYLAQQLLAEKQLPFDLLRPLILETAEKVQDICLPRCKPVRRYAMTKIQWLRICNYCMKTLNYKQLYKLLSQGIIKMDNAGVGGIVNFVTFAQMNIFKVKINFEEKGHESVELPIAEGESVLDVCLENGIELQHNCGGVCGCSTCHIYVNKGMDNIQEISDKEEDFIDRAVNPRINSRLGCQCVIIDGDIEVTLPDQSNFMGH